jgi:transcriptional antiterminator NusG
MIIHFPQRQLNIRKGGVRKIANLAVFPGYIFVETDDILSFQKELKSTEGFRRFLKSNKEITPLSSRDLELVLHFIDNKNPAVLSKVYFNENSRIVVLEGPLVGLEGRILKVDKRKGRAKIKLDLYDDSFLIDLAFEVISPERGAK